MPKFKLKRTFRCEWCGDGIADDEEVVEAKNINELGEYLITHHANTTAVHKCKDWGSKGYQKWGFTKAIGAIVEQITDD
jgi:hypothetical protein